ncbi:MAG: hypothetical protein KDA65_15730, partial [Planctomycetaceae bacterium]|nr:hypothetical protein [Planctomycetaceae bacterium]
MATTSQSETQQYVDFEEYVDFQLQKIRKQVRGHDLLLSTITLFTFLIGYLFIFSIFDQWIIPGGFSYSLRLLLLCGFVGVVSGWLWFRIWRPYQQQIN